ncbi:MAG: phosphohistidine phosphatase SixA [Magnetococcales bacterium]|nr:phosphohistidine phosphatase SixA [Magnetococcales bacterium]
MKLLLAHHGEAVPKEVDRDRPLTPRGISEIERSGAFLAHGGVRVARICHSGKTRARQTADILARYLSDHQNLEIIPHIRPKDSADYLLYACTSWEKDTLIAGHGPHITRFVSLVLAGAQAPAQILSQPGTILCLERTEAHPFRLLWMLPPMLLTSP